jgi:tRNA(Ile)-lysidine synthase
MLLDGFLSFINENNLCTKEQKGLLTVSGGMDSVLMVELFAKAGFSFSLAHCNFGLRAEESDADELFVKKLAIKYKVPFYSTTFNTKAYADTNKLSIQMAARDLRYAWFEQLAKEHSFQYIATAHHQTDNTETVLLNLSKGTGLAGLHGIVPKRGLFIRPLLFANKDQMLDYVVESQLIWREDSSNESVKYQRNKIRHEVLPILKEINPNLDETFKRSTEKIQWAETFLNDQKEQFKKQYLEEKEGSHYLNMEPLKLDASLKYIYAEIFADFGFNYLTCKELLLSVSEASGLSYESPMYTAQTHGNQWVIVPNNNSAEFQIQEIVLENIEKDLVFHEESGLRFELIENTENYKIPTAKNMAALDFDTLKLPLKFRYYKEGDWFCPLGMNAKKSVADFLNGEKVPLLLKKETKLLLSDLSIAWIIGHRVDNRFKITEKTTRILLVSQKKSS